MSKPEYDSAAVRLDSPSHGESPSRAAKPGVGTRIKAFLRRWWWLLLIIFVCLVLIIVLPIIFVGAPRKAQREVNESYLEVRSVVLSDPSSNSLHLRQDEILHSDSGRHPHLDAFNASLFLESSLPDIRPFGYVTVPAVHSTGAVPVIVDQDVDIVDMEQFTRFSKTILGAREFRLAIRGRTGLKQTGLPKMTVDYNEVVTLKGLDRLQGFDVTEFRVLLEPEEDGANMVGEVSIPNPSVLTIELGNVTANLLVEGDLIGTALLPELTLRPGGTVSDMRATTTNQALVLQKLADYPDGLLPVDIVGNSSVYNGQHLTYYEEALRGNTVSIKLNVASGLGG